MYDAENRLTSVSGAAAATFVYGGDGNRVKATFDSTTTVYVGNIYEMSGSTVLKYYYAGGVRVATPALAPERSTGASVRSGTQTYYLLGDHLGGTASPPTGSMAQNWAACCTVPGAKRVSAPAHRPPRGALQDSGKMLQSGCITSMRDTSIPS